MPGLCEQQHCLLPVRLWTSIHSGVTCSNAVQVPELGRLLDFTIIGVKMDVLIAANIPGGPPQPLPMTDYLSMNEQLKVNDQISVIHFPQNPPGFQRCSNTLNIINMEGASQSHALMWVTSMSPVGSCMPTVHVYIHTALSCMSMHVITSPWYLY